MVVNIVKVILKSGTNMDLSKADKTEIVSREEVQAIFKGEESGEDIKWTPVPQRKIVSFLRVYKGEEIWEIREDEIAAFQYLKGEEEQEQEKNIII